MFSFNSGDGRCPTCGGSGFEHVEMQFLSDVYLRCPDCDGRRYRAEILEVKIGRGPRDAERRRRAGTDGERGRRAVARTDAEVLRVLQPIVDVGLEYVKLGQPVPTLVGRRGAAAQAGGLPRREPRRRRGREGRASLHVRRTDHGACTSTISPSCMQALRRLLEARGHSLS